MRLFEDISLTEILVAWIGFIVGFGVGVLFSWPIKKIADKVGTGVLFSWPFRKKADTAFDENIQLLLKEVEGVDTEIGKLWSMTFGPNYLRPVANVIKAGGADKKTEASTDLKNTRTILANLADNLRQIALNVEPRSRQNIDTPLPNPDAHLQEPHNVSIDQPTISRPYREEEYELPRDRPNPGKTINTFKATQQNPLYEMVQLYNLAVNDTVAREQFREQFCPVRIGTVNAVERRQNPTIKADIRETTDGEFFALPISGTKEFAVFPRLGLTIEAVSFSAGAVGEVFGNTQGHNPKLFYSHYTVKQPAIFRLEGEHWNLKEPGELKLGYGDA